MNPENRNETIRARRLAGETLQAIADDYGLTREGVRQVANRYDPTISKRGIIARLERQRLEDVAYDDRMSAEVQALLEAEGPLTRFEVCARLGVDPDRVTDYAGPLAHLLYTEYRQYRGVLTDDEVLAGVRRAAALAGEPLTTVKYARVREAAGAVYPGTLDNRYGSWNAALEAAGVRHGTAVRTYTRRWTHEDLLDVVEEWVDTGGGTWREFAHWLEGDPDSPSAALIRRRLGKWSEIMARVRERRARSEHGGTPPPNG